MHFLDELVGLRDDHRAPANRLAGGRIRPAVWNAVSEPLGRPQRAHAGDAVEKRLARMLRENPTRTNFQSHYEEIVAAYNGEKDRVTIEATFEALLKFTAALDDESKRAMREGLALTFFDLLKKPDLTKKDIDRLKKVAASLLAILEQRKREIDDWRAKEVHARCHAANNLRPSRPSVRETAGGRDKCPGSYELLLE